MAYGAISLPANPDLIPRMQEVLTLLDAKHPDLKSRSARNKGGSIAQCFAEIIRNDSWKVRNLDLMIKAATWIREFVVNGNLAAMANFTKLKCMTYNGKPIYSMEEIT
jgi:hypothetical protein